MKNTTKSRREATQRNQSAVSTRRRNTLKSLAWTGALSVPAGWSRPLVESVVLPAHAQTSAARGLRASGAGLVTITLTGPA
ncbi:MAG TPA: hypothetical protein VK973_02040 [Arenicellales bacterium]|nr:hypothetical protein [Arenicellales bacterium]